MQNNELAHSHDFLRRVSAQREVVTRSLRQALRETAFSNRKLIAPRRLDAISEEEIEGFLEFLQSEDQEAVRDHGRHLAQEGLGHHSILMMTEALRGFCRESVNPGQEVAGCYANALLEGYMAARERVLLQEQERIHEAYLRARERQEGQ